MSARDALGALLTARRVAFVLLGEPASKANSRQIVCFGKRLASIKSAKARSYETHAAIQIPSAACLMLEGPVRVTIRVLYATERPDLDESVILDVMQAKYSKPHGIGGRFLVRAGVYLNDRQVREKHIYHGIDKANPRAEIVVEELRC